MSVNCVLLLVKLEDYEAASTTFEEALELAKNQQNKEALDSIEKVRGGSSVCSWQHSLYF